MLILWYVKTTGTGFFQRWGMGKGTGEIIAKTLVRNTERVREYFEMASTDTEFPT